MLTAIKKNKNLIYDLSFVIAMWFISRMLICIIMLIIAPLFPVASNGVLPLVGMFSMLGIVFGMKRLLLMAMIFLAM